MRTREEPTNQSNRGKWVPCTLLYRANGPKKKFESACLVQTLSATNSLIRPPYLNILNVIYGYNRSPEKQNAIQFRNTEHPNDGGGIRTNVNHRGKIVTHDAVKMHDLPEILSWLADDVFKL